MAGILDGLKVVSMEQYYVIPMASVLMADWGADVIRVEPPAGEPSRQQRARAIEASAGIRVNGFDVNPGSQFMNRNKRGLAVDLKKEVGRDILCQLVHKADVFMSNYQLDALKKLRLDYGTLRQLNPRLIYATVTGYGSKGPDKDERVLDIQASWARSGMAHLLTVPGSIPPGQPQGMGDRVTSVHVVAGILAALLHREKTGMGQEVECCLFHSALWSISAEINGALSRSPMGRDPRNKAGNPLSNYYLTRDNRWLLFAMSRSDFFWSDFCRAIDRPELENDPHFSTVETRRKNCEELVRILDEVFASKTIEEWEKLCRKHQLMYSRIQSPAEVITDPQALANGFFVDLPHPAAGLKVLASPVKFSQNPASVRALAPGVGQHTREILCDLGYKEDDVARLREQGVI